MRCRNCGGELKYIEGVWTCNSCGKQYSTQDFLEDVEVYICYLENDESGRRTKDSAIAQEIYNLLEEKKIKTFYKRISASECTGSVADEVDTLALANSKVVLLVGTTSAHFEKIWKANEARIIGKRIIPVYFGMNANDIPKEINAIQALKYDSVAASADLVRGVLNILGRKQEAANYEELHKKESDKRKTVLGIIIAIVIIALIVGGFIWNNISKRQMEDSSEVVQSDNEVVEEIPEESDESTLYEKAVGFMDDERYAEAITALSELGDYKDAKLLKHTCYAKYAGYYLDEDSNTFLHLQVYEDENCGVEIYKIDGNGDRCTVSENTIFDICTTEFAFTDNENNNGNANMELTNDGIVLKLTTSEINSQTYISDTEAKFFLDNKEDQPIRKEVTLAALKEILSKKTTLGDLIRQGYDLSNGQPIYRGSSELTYDFDRTNVSIAVAPYNLDSLEMDEYGLTTFTEELEDPVVYAIVGPASIVAPDKIGEKNEPFVEDDYLFLPNGYPSFADGALLMGADGEAGQKQTISETDMVAFCCKATAGEIQYSETVKALMVSGAAFAKYFEDYSESATYYDVLNEDDEKYEVYVKTNYDAGEGLVYNVYKKDFSAENTGVRQALLDGGTYLLHLWPEGDGSYVHSIKFEGNSMIVDGCIAQYTYDYADRIKEIKSSRIVIDIDDDAKFFFTDSEGEEYISRERFKELMTEQGSNWGIDLRILIQNKAVSFGFYS